MAGDRVAVLGANRPTFLDATIGCLRSGLVPVPLDVHLPAHVLAERLADADPGLVLVHEEFLAAARSLGVPVEVMTDGWLRDVVPADLPAWPQTRAMHYTSGTTGRGKGVYAGHLGVNGGRAVAEEERAIWDFRPDDVHLVCGPLYHSGPHRFALNTLLYGGSVMLLDGFDAGAALSAIVEHRVTTTFAVPTHLARLLTDPGCSRDALSSFRWVAHAGAPCPLALKQAAMEAFPAGSVHEFYGSTEGQFTVITPEQWLQRPGSVGCAREGRRLSVVRDDGSEAAVGEVGEVYTSAPDFARFEYWHDPEATAQAWDGDRFTVRDLGSVDEDGYLYLAGRTGDLIITGGVNVYPAEVERELLAHPDVFEAAVFGVPDPEWGERVCAAVVPAAGAALDGEQLRRWARHRLTGAQTPKRIAVLADLPRTGSGKVRRGDLPGVVAPPS